MSKKDFVEFINNETFGRNFLISTSIAVGVSFALLLRMYI